MNPDPVTLLLVVPPDDPLGLLAPSRGGGMAPTAYLAHRAGTPTKPCPVCGSATRWSSDGDGDGDYLCAAEWRHEFRQADVLIPVWHIGRYRDHPRALVLAVEGEPDHDGMGRLVRALVAALRSTEPKGTVHWTHPTYDVEYEEQGDCEFGTNPSYPAALTVAGDGVWWRLDLPEDLPAGSDAEILAGMLARLSPTYRLARIDAATGREIP